MDAIKIESNIEEVRLKWSTILSKAKTADEVVIFGVSHGTDAHSYLVENGCRVTLYFDNSSLYENTKVNGLLVCKPYMIDKKDVFYVICVKSDENKKKLTEQLISLGVDKENIECIPRYERDTSNLQYYKTDEMLVEISNMYEEITGDRPNLINPQKYTEIVNSKKINMGELRYTQLVDKLLVKEYIKDKIGEEFVVPLLGVWDKSSEIDYDLLPDKFVLKTNHASGRNIIVEDKKKVNIAEVNCLLDRWLNENYGYFGFSLQYRDIKPKIICEEYLEGLAETVYDYQFFCFNGEPKYIWCINGSHRVGCRASFYDLDWNMQPFSLGYPKDDVIAPRPKRLEEMIEISKLLAKEFEHVRVDLYEMPDGRLLFGELTFQTWGGFRRFYPPQYDLLMGDLFIKK